MKIIIKTALLSLCLIIMVACGEENINEYDKKIEDINMYNEIKEKDVLRNFSMIEDVDKEKVVSIKFIAGKEIPKNVDKSWNMSENEEIKGWLIDNELTIAQDQGVKIAPEGIEFGEFKNVEKIEFLEVDTSEVVTMTGMFHGCKKIKELDLSKFNTIKVQNMDYMFSGCSELKKLDLSNLNTNKVTNMKGMFVNCSGLEELDVSNFNMSNVVNMDDMFKGCSNVKGLDPTKFDLSKIY